MKTKERRIMETGGRSKFCRIKKKRRYSEHGADAEIFKRPTAHRLFRSNPRSSGGGKPELRYFTGRHSVLLSWPSYEAPQRPPTAFSYRSVGFVARRALPRMLSKIDLRRRSLLVGEPHDQTAERKYEGKKKKKMGKMV